MPRQIKGLFWHVHDDALVGISTNISETRGEICEEHDNDDGDLWLRLLKPVRFVPIQLRRAVIAACRARDARGDALAWSDHLDGQDPPVRYDEEELAPDRDDENPFESFARGWDGDGDEDEDEDWDEDADFDRRVELAHEETSKAETALTPVWDTYLRVLAETMPELEALHKEQCPNCPWDGKTIFPKKG